MNPVPPAILNHSRCVSCWVDRHGDVECEECSFRLADSLSTDPLAAAQRLCETAASRLRTAIRLRKPGEDCADLISDAIQAHRAAGVALGEASGVVPSTTCVRCRIADAGSNGEEVTP